VGPADGERPSKQLLGLCEILFQHVEQAEHVQLRGDVGMVRAV
jgi:hypothetical protein